MSDRASHSPKLPEPTGSPPVPFTSAPSDARARAWLEANFPPEIPGLPAPGPPASDVEHGPSNDWGYAWPEDNDPHPTPWYGYDKSNFTIYGGREDPNETAAVPSADVRESIEAEGDPLVAMRRTVRDSQAVIRSELEQRVGLEDENRELRARNERVEGDNEALSERNRFLERSRRDARIEARSLAQERDLVRRERDRATGQAERLRLALDEPEEAYRGAQARQLEFEELVEAVRGLRRAEDALRDELESATRRADGLRRERDRGEDDREQLEMERDHYQTERDRLRDHNLALQEQVQFLVTRLRAAEALAPQPTINAPLAAPAPVAPAPVSPAPVYRAPAAEPGAGRVRRGERVRGRGGARGRGARGRRGAGTATRSQPGRLCKMNKSYKP